MQTLGEIRALLAERGLSPRHALGQNFLLDHNLIGKLVEASGAGPGDLVLEVGPGTGVLTEMLLERGCEVVACELDRGLADLLRERVAPRYPEAFVLVEGDCLAGKRAVNPAVLAALGDRPFRLVANLPYGAATPLMLALMVDHPACTGQFVTIQKEVVDRFSAEPGTKAYGTISVVAGCLMDLRRLGVLGPECFWPRPKVTSAMLALTRRETPLTDDGRSLAEFCQRAFAGRRKQLGTVLKQMGRTPENGPDAGRGGWPVGVEPGMRVESLSAERISALEAACRTR